MVGPGSPLPHGRIAQGPLQETLRRFGVFQLHGEGEFLNPFEGTGVDTQWEFRMEKAANPFDFGSIADVLITIEYEAMNSFLWRNTVVQRLNIEPATAALAISMKNNLPDQWFDLHNPEQTETPYAVSFRIGERDLVPNLTAPKTTGISMYFIMKDGKTFNGMVLLGLDSGGEQEASPNDNFVGANTFTSITTSTPADTWHFSIPGDSTSAQAHFDNDEVDDVVIIIAYDGEGPDYNL